MPLTAGQRLAAGATGALSRLLFGFTLRWLRNACRWHLRGPLDGALGDDNPFVVAIWHQDVLLFFHYLAIANRLERRRTMTMLSSRSFDGEVTERLMRPWGFELVRGSRGKRGAPAALRGLRRALEAGSPVALVADGPGPPPGVMSPGPVYLARETGVPLYLARAWARPQWLAANSWFRPALALGHAHIALFSAGPVDVSGTLEEARARAEARLDALCEEADAHLYLGRRPVGGVRLAARSV